MSTSAGAPRFEGPLKDFADYVRSLDQGYVPTVGQFDLMAIHRLAPMVVVLDVLAEERRLRCRFVGTKVVAMHGSDATGRDVQDLFVEADGVRELIESYWRVADAARPLFTRSRVMRPDEPDQLFAYGRLAVPLLDEAGRVARIATVITRCRADEMTTDFSAVDVA